MGRFFDALGTVFPTFKVGKAKFDASGLTAQRTFTLPDADTVLGAGGGTGMQVAVKVEGVSNALDVHRIYNPSGGELVIPASSTGAWKIALPTGLFALDVLLDFRIKLLTAEDDKSCDISFSGSWLGTSSQWSANESARINATTALGDFTVRTGHDGTRPCVWIAEAASAWSATACLSVLEVTATGYSADQPVTLIQSGWAVTLVTAFGTINSVVVNNLGAWSGGTPIDINGLDMVARVDVPANPIAGRMTLFPRNVANKIIPSYIGADGGVSTVQAHLGRGKHQIVTAHGNSTGVTNYGGQAMVVTGFVSTARNVATTNLLTETRRIGYVTTATASTAFSIRTSLAQYFMSANAGRGGFFKIFRFGYSQKVAGDRAFFGMGASTVQYAVADPSTFINIVGIGYDAADTQWQLMHNDGTATATKIALGANFTINTTDLLEVILFAEPGAGSVVHTLVRNLSTGLNDSVRTLSTKLPAVNTLLSWHSQINTGATATASAYDFVSLYIETDT